MLVQSDMTWSGLFVSHLIDPHPYGIWLRHKILSPDLNALQSDFYSVVPFNVAWQLFVVQGDDYCNFSSCLHCLGYCINGSLGVFGGWGVGTPTKVEIWSAYRAHFVSTQTTFSVRERTAPFVGQRRPWSWIFVMFLFENLCTSERSCAA